MRRSRSFYAILLAMVLISGSIGLMYTRHRMANGDGPAWLVQGFQTFTLTTLPEAEYRLVEFLMQLPLGALIVVLSRNVIGLTTFGVFTPALLGLAFREVDSGLGILVFLAILLIGWVLRKALQPMYLLQVPRTALMLSFVVLLVVTFVVILNTMQLHATRYIALYPMVILTGIIERFWILEEEDGSRASFRTLLSTLLVSGCVMLVLQIRWIHQSILMYPESLGLVMAFQVLLGRYTGYRLVELYRFRHLAK